MLEIPLIANPNQQLNVNLNNQNCTIRIQDREGYSYLDLSVGNTVISQGALCAPRALIITKPAAFVGNLVLVDTYSTSTTQSNPVYTGYGTRWRLYYVTKEEEEEYFGYQS